MEEKELFEGYEIKSWELNPRIYKILGASMLAHLLFFTVFAQFNLLSAKACDSPYVGKVCQVLDATYLATVFLGEDSSFVDRDYNKTEIAESDEITFVDVSQIEPPLQYPEGYFALANPESAMMNQDMLMPMDGGGFPTTPGSPTPQLDLNAPQVLPTPNNDVANQPLPDSPFSFENEPAPVKTTRVPATRPSSRNRNQARNTKPKNQTPKPEGEETANANANTNTNQAVAANKPENANKTEEELADDQFNQKPLKDWGAKYGDKILSRDININAPFVIEVIAGLDEHGKLVKPVMRTTPESDPKMTEAAKEAIAAFSDSHLLKPLYLAGGRNIKITFAQDKDNLKAIIQTETPSESRANLLSSFLNVYIQNNKPKEGSDEAVLMSKAQFATQGKVFIINFLISNEEKNQMIEKNLKNLKQELEKARQPNGLAENKNKSPKA